MTTTANGTQVDYIGRMGNGTALHIVNRNGAICNRWGSTNGTVRPPREVKGAEATCKRCLHLATA